MRFLADENVWASMIRALVDQGHDVVQAKHVAPGQTDLHWLRYAADEGCILLTEDADFGHLVFGMGYATHGVVLIPFGLFRGDRHEIGRDLARRITDLAPSLPGRWTVLDPKRTRQRRLNPDPAGSDED